MLHEKTPVVNREFARLATLGDPIPCELGAIRGAVVGIRNADTFICPHCWQQSTEPQFFRVYPAGRGRVWVYGLCGACTTIQHWGALQPGRIAAFFRAGGER